MAPNGELRPANSPGPMKSNELSDLEKAAAMLASQGNREFATGSIAGSCKYTQASYPSTPRKTGNESRATETGSRYSARGVLGWGLQFGGSTVAGGSARWGGCHPQMIIPLLLTSETVFWLCLRLVWVSSTDTPCFGTSSPHPPPSTLHLNTQTEDPTPHTLNPGPCRRTQQSWISSTRKLSGRHCTTATQSRW